MKNNIDYSKYKCPYEHLVKDCGHKLIGPEGFQDVYSVWCACGFRGPVFYLEPDQLNLERKDTESIRKTFGSLMYTLDGFSEEYGNENYGNSKEWMRHIYKSYREYVDLKEELE